VSYLFGHELENIEEKSSTFTNLIEEKQKQESLRKSKSSLRICQQAICGRKILPRRDYFGLCAMDKDEARRMIFFSHH
jgi:hypothetical protein